MANKNWLNRNILAMSIVSFLGDFGYESVTTILPAFLTTIGLGASALGLIEGSADAISSFTKLGSGYYADKSGKNKQISIFGYSLTSIFPAIIATASGFWQVLSGRVLGWFGRGVRGPPRDAILSESVEKKDLGKAFGFHRAGDTLGAIAGPVLALLLLPFIGYREIMWYSVIPGILAAIIFALFVKNKFTKRNTSVKFSARIKNLPNSFKNFLAGAGVFGIADYSHTLLILFAVTSLAPVFGLLKATALAASFYVVRNVVYAAASYPAGYLGDALGKKKILVAGYLLATLMNIGFIVLHPSIWAFLLLFSIAGFYVAIYDALEGAISGQILEKKTKSIGYGVLGSVNGVGDFISSAVVGFLWAAFAPIYGFAYAAIFSFVGASILARVKIK